MSVGKALAALKKGVREWFEEDGIGVKDHPPLSGQKGGKACPNAPSGAHARRGFARKPVRPRQKTAPCKKEAQGGKLLLEPPF